jgi:hypothetical protein
MAGWPMWTKSISFLHWIAVLVRRLAGDARCHQILIYLIERVIVLVMNAAMKASAAVSEQSSE